MGSRWTMSSSTTGGPTWTSLSPCPNITGKEREDWRLKMRRRTGNLNKTRKQSTKEKDLPPKGRMEKGTIATPAKEEITRRTGGSIAGETERKVMTIREQVKMTEKKVMTIREQVKMAKTTEMNEGMTMEGQGEDLMIEEGMMMTGGMMIEERMIGEGMMTEGKIAGTKEGMVVMAIEWMEITAERMVMTGDGMVMMIIL